jgi:hypothetical protein
MKRTEDLHSQNCLNCSVIVLQAMDRNKTKLVLASLRFLQLHLKGLGLSEVKMTKLVTNSNFRFTFNREL